MAGSGSPRSRASSQRSPGCRSRSRRSSAQRFAVRRDGDGAIVEAGRFLGVSVGDVYRVVPASAPDAGSVATLTIDDVSPLQARASRIAWASGHRELPVHPTATATALAIERDPVRIVAPDHVRHVVVEAVRASPRLRPGDRGRWP